MGNDAKDNTPPTSPGFFGNDDDQLEENDAIEVIDLDDVDELLENDSDDDQLEDDFDEGEGASGVDGASMAVGESISASSTVQDPAVLEPAREDNSEISFDLHKKSVFCCSVHPSQPLVASGGEDDKAYLWNYSTAEVTLTCGGFKDSVVHVGFSHDGHYLAAADMSGLIRVWKLSCKEVVWEFETTDVTWMDWHPSANVLFVTTVESELWMWKIPSGESKVFMGHGERAERAKVLPDGKRTVVGYGDGSMRLFDLKTGNVLYNMTGNNAHSGAVTSLDAQDGNVLMASGGVDGVTKVFNTQTGKGIGAFLCGEKAEESETSNSTVEAVLFSKQDYLVTGTLEGNVTVWDMSTQVSRLSVTVGTGITKMAWRNGSSSELFVATLDGLVRVIDVRTGKVLADCSGHGASILDLAQSQDGSCLVTASDDGLCKVFNLEKVMSSS